MLLQRHNPRICHKKHKTRSQAQRVFKTAPLFAVTNPTPTATPTVLAAFTTFFESLWSPITGTAAAAAQKSGMSYVYDEDGTLIADTLTGGASTTWGQSARYIYLPTASGPMPVAAIYGTKHYAIQSDHLNTPRRLIQSDGQVAWQWAYSAFGDEQPTVASNRFANTSLNQSFGTTTVPAVTFNLRYPGQYFDQETGLHYNYHRSYSATTGRYTQSDPIGLDGGWNRFGYVGQNPLSFMDPEGLQATIVTKTGPISGNWGGKDWSGGLRPSQNGGEMGIAPPLNSVDVCAKEHDTCWFEAEGSNRVCVPSAMTTSSKDICDARFAACLRALPFNPANWPLPPQPGTAGDVTRFLNGGVYLGDNNFFRKRER